MGIDWGLVATIAAPLVVLVVGSFLTRRPVVTMYLGHVACSPSISLTCSIPLCHRAAGWIPLFTDNRMGGR